MPSGFRSSDRILSAGRSHRFRHEVGAATTVEECRALLRAAPAGWTLLPMGAAQSLGDCCLNEGGALIVTRGMKRISHFDAATGLLTCEPGLTVGELASATLSTPDGKSWFPAVFTGTTEVTVAGAIANDVHGKNHFAQGTFCHHVEALQLLRSDGTLLDCDEEHNADLFRATLGGLGLTGIIVSVTLRLGAVPGPLLESEEFKCGSLAEAFPLFAESARDWEHRFFWFDTFDPAGRGIFTRSRHCAGRVSEAEPPSILMRTLSQLPLPALLGGPTLWRSWYAFSLSRAPLRQTRRLSYQNALAPLGGFPRWNRLLGPRGLFHLQAVFPERQAHEFLAALLAECRSAGEPPCIASMKRFGPRRPRGLLTFPREGVTTALDFANRGESTRRLLRRLEARVIEAGGALYPGKDSTLTPEGFRRGFPEWERFAEHVDPRFSSSLWRRVAGDRQ